MKRLGSALAAWMGILLAFAAPVAAQRTERQILELNERAMEAYNNLEVETAVRLLEQARQLAERNDVHGSALAKTYVNLGVVVIGGAGQADRGLDLFVRALREDPSVAPDPMASTPEIQAAFDAARRRVGSGTGSAEAPPDNPYGTQEGGGGSSGGGGTTGGTATSANEDECPPGMECAGGSLAEGEPCRRDSQCRSGLVCNEEWTCAPGGDDLDEEDGDGGDRRIFVEVGFAAGLGFAQAGHEADRLATVGPEFGDHVLMMSPDGTGFAYDVNDDGAVDMNDQINEQFVSPATRCRDLASNAGLQSECYTARRNIGYAPAGSQECPGNRDCVEITKNGFLFVPALRLTFGYWLTDRVALAALLRVQFLAGSGTMSRFLLGLRLEYLLTDPGATEGFRGSILGGLGFGQIQLRPAQPSGADAPFLVSGPLEIGLGAGLGYRFTPSVGIKFTPELHLLVPSVLFAADINVGVEIAF